VNNNNPAVIFSAFAASQFVAVRPSLDTSKDTISLTMSARPNRLVTVKGEFKGEFLHRDNVSAIQSASTWFLPENSETYTGTLSILSRPLAGLRLKALYSYSTDVHPSYGTSFASRNEGQFLATYNKTDKWGVTANYQLRRDSNDQITRDTIVSTTPLAFSPFPVPLGRNQATDNATVSLWFTPMNKLTVTGSYGFLRSSADQAVLFTVVAPATADATNYTNQAQIYSINSVYQLNERLDLSLMLQQIRSFSEFTPQFLVVSGSANTAGINLISRTNTVESSLSVRADYHVNKNISCAVDYTFRDYDEKNSMLFNGSVNSVMAYLSAKW
jgi:predicted porin